MKFVKEDDEKRRDYIFQKDKKTIFTARFVGAVLVVLVVAVVVTYFFL